MTRTFAFLLGASLCAAPLAFAGNEPGAGAEAPGKTGSHSDRGNDVYGHEVMTPSEIDRYQTQMRGTMTDSEREAFLDAHRDEMQQRARDRGVTLREGPGLDRSGTGSGTGTPGGARTPDVDGDM